MAALTEGAVEVGGEEFPVEKDVAEVVADCDAAVVVEEDNASVDDEPTHVGITVRSLSGQEVQFPQLPLDLSVAGLKEMIQDQNENFPANQQKLLIGSKALKDHETLRALKLKNGAVIHMVKVLSQSSSPSSSLSSSSVVGGSSQTNSSTSDDSAGVEIRRNAPGAQNLLTVVVPENAGPGTRLLLNPPGREQMSVVVPQGLGPGQRFQVRLPERRSPNRMSVRRSVGRSPGGSGSVMQVQCPANARSGQQILIEVPNVGRMRVQVPPGVQPGQMFRFRIP